ncbi:MAG: outer membrane protein assembly factor BamD [bacterium]
MKNNELVHLKYATIVLLTIVIVNWFIFPSLVMAESLGLRLEKDIFLEKINLLREDLSVDDSKKLLEFADSFFIEEEYYRAITEYKRFIFYFPQHPDVPRVEYQVGLAFLNGERWEEAVGAFKMVVAKYPFSPIGEQARLNIGQTYYKMGDYENAIEAFKNFIVTSKNPNLISKVEYLLGCSYIQIKQWEAAYGIFCEIAQSKGEYSFSAQYIKKQMEERDKLSYKSPTVAGVLSGVLPGAGQLYDQRPMDAITSLLINGLFAWGAIESFNHDLDAVGGLLLFFETGWYTANIYGAVQGAKKYNEREEKNFIDSFKSHCQLSMGAPHKGKGVTFFLSYRF